MYLAPSYSFNRPGDTTQYGANELVADNTAAGSVKHLRFNCETIKGRGRIFGARIFKSTSTVTAAKFNLHVYARPPVPTNGDNGTFAVDTVKYWLATIACDMSSGNETVTSTEIAQYFALTNPVMFDLNAEGVGDGSVSPGPILSLYGLLETQSGAAYAPGASELFKAVLNIEG